MKIRVVRNDVASIKTPALVVNLFDGVKKPGGATGAVDKALDGAISQLIKDGEIKGKKGETTLIHTFGKIPAARVIVLGLGKRESFTTNTVREVTAASSRYLRRLGVAKAATIAHGAGIGGLDPLERGQAIGEGSILGLYRFRTYLTKGEDDGSELVELQIVEKTAKNATLLRRGVEKGRVLAEAVLLARDMVNEPPNVMTPTRMAEVASDVADEHGLELKVLDKGEMEELGMGALLGVARGSVQPPKLIMLSYKGAPDSKENLGIIGKGITFDTGGISLKPPGGMEDMKGDMAGGASVIASMKAIAQLKPRINVTGIIGATENMPGGNAQRPGDVVRSMSGKTIEIINTDAEGRLVLADALHYARQQGVTRIVDIATLTGAMVVALGHAASGLMGNNQEFADQVIAVGNDSGERIWQFPMYDDYKEEIKSNVADVKNSGGRPAGSISAAQFLSEFVDDTPWAHLDIAGTYFSKSEKGYLVKGGTGVPTRTLVNLAMTLADDD